ncbi:VOC family protein [Streptomyces ipomoeae]|uniref:VOC family protein n=1 Tax=Streptomyces ipomoeae TaxID=103232 RepID=UPI001146E642|nr:VOC family protein [Streptomyces ipomoeae]MDX2937783.1 VOC family protein [Streptomyces ipomoeae]TQE17212.1 2,3-dihydroxybiphenyl 1,2-dioxygenase [Streptomyces ipomoeae]
MASVEIDSLAYLGFESPAVDRWPAFATEIFGFGLGSGASPDTVYLRTDSRHHRVAIHPGDEDRLAYIGWEVRDAQALARARAALEAAGVTVEVADDKLLEERAVVGMISVVDPAGFRHEFAYGQSYQLHSFVPGRVHEGFVGEELGLGHVVVVAPVTDEYRRFLCEVLGLSTYADFPVTMPGGAQGSALFLRCNERTHCFAVLGLPGLHGVQHFEVEARSMLDVGIAYDLVQEREVPISMTLGSHTIDPVVSFYCRTPSGFDLEFAHGGWSLPQNAVVGKPDKPEIWGHKFTGVGLPTTIRPLVTDA